MCNIMILVNREHPLDPDYIPPELQEADFPFLAGSGDPKRLLCRPAALAGKELFDRCRMEGLSLYGISGYRSYERQSSLYLKKGNPADLYLAPPAAANTRPAWLWTSPARRQILNWRKNSPPRRKAFFWKNMPLSTASSSAIPREKKKSPDTPGNPGICAT